MGCSKERKKGNSWELSIYFGSSYVIWSPRKTLPGWKGLYRINLVADDVEVYQCNQRDMVESGCVWLKMKPFVGFSLPPPRDKTSQKIM